MQRQKPNITAGRYFLKLDYAVPHQLTYRESLSVIEALCSQGIDFIGSIVKTKTGCLCTDFSGAVLAVFDWIDGENLESDETKLPEYTMLCKVYAKTKPGFNIPHAEFTAAAADRFFTRWELLKDQTGDPEAQKVCALLTQKSAQLKHYASRLAQAAEVCRRRSVNYYFTHGDAGGNLLAGKAAYFIPDWDEVMYAPPERDAWVMCCHPWAVRLFNKALQENHVNDQLRPEFLAFYCYHMYFHYLNEFFKGFTRSDLLTELDEYFNCWIVQRMDYAETIQC